MNKIKFSTNFAVFVIFFGISLLEAFQTHNWATSLFWLSVGTIFLLADNLKKSH